MNICQYYLNNRRIAYKAYKLQKETISVEGAVSSLLSKKIIKPKQYEIDNMLFLEKEYQKSLIKKIDELNSTYGDDTVPDELSDSIEQLHLTAIIECSTLCQYGWKLVRIEGKNVHSNFLFEPTIFDSLSFIDIFIIIIIAAVSFAFASIGK